MKERSTLMSGAMVRATLANRKTMTRRVMRNGDWAKRPCPYGQPGDRLWVRETWAVDAPLEQVRREHEDAMGPVQPHGPYYRADPVHENSGLRWRPSIHMPRWASRITLEVAGVRVERLNSISEEDAANEGVWSWWESLRGSAYDRALFRANKNRQPCDECKTARDRFVALWDSINGKTYPWSTNPWVWVVLFRRVL